MKQLATPVLAAALLCAANTATAQATAPESSDASSRLLAAGCVACHGTAGRAQAGGIALAGIKAGDFIVQMQAFKSGQRPATVMHQIAKGYGDAEIAALAKYFSAQTP